MIDVSLREFANRSEEEILEWLGQPYKVLLTDDEGNSLETNTYDLMISWYGLETHRKYNRMPYHIKEVVKCESYNNSDLQTPINYFLEQLCDEIDDPLSIDEVKRIVFAWQTKLNNFLVIFGERGVVCASAPDVVSVADSPEVSGIKRRYYAKEITIDQAEDEFHDVILYSETLPNGIFTTQARTGAVSVNQGFQTFITLGQRFDINNRILPNPIMPSYGDGLTNIADILADSRSAGKALNSNGKALEDSEWFHRKLHLYCNPILEVYTTHDCHTTTTIPVKIKDSVHAESLIGKYFVEEPGGRAVALRKRHVKKFKVGDLVNLRSIAYCRNPSGSPCNTCYGKMKAMIPYNVISGRSANPGMFSATAIAERIGQALLSTKHFMRHTAAIPFVVIMGDEDKISTDGDFIYLTKDFLANKPQLILPKTLRKELSDFTAIENLEDLDEDRGSKFVTASFRFTKEDPMVPGHMSENITHVFTSVSSRRAMFSRQFIEYIVKNQYDTDKLNIYVDLTDFGTEDPIFKLPYVHEDLNQYRKEAEDFLTLKGHNDNWRSRPVTPESFSELVNEFWTLINRKFKGFNIIHAETLIYALCARDPSTGQFRLPRGDETRYFVPFKDAIENRGAGSMIFYQKQQNVFEDPTTYDVKGRQPTCMEGFLHNAL